jgi:holo-[acyl-carrier protein] synthase
MLSLGTDIVEISRVKHWADDPDMLSFVFTKSERDATMAARYPHRRLAAVFAVKEALLKAAGTGWGEAIRWSDIEVSGLGSDCEVRLYNSAKDLCGSGRVFASCDCSKEHAVALVVIDI